MLNRWCFLKIYQPVEENLEVFPKKGPLTNSPTTPNKNEFFEGLLQLSKGIGKHEKTAELAVDLPIILDHAENCSSYALEFGGNRYGACDVFLRE